MQEFLVPFPEPDRQLFSDTFLPPAQTCQDSFEFDGSWLFLSNTKNATFLAPVASTTPSLASASAATRTRSGFSVTTSCSSVAGAAFADRLETVSAIAALVAMAPAASRIFFFIV